MPETNKIITRAEVAQHKDSKTGVWITIHGNVYDVSKFLEEVLNSSNWMGAYVCPATG